MLTGDPSESEKNKCLNILKVNSFFNKPISIQQFVVELRKIFNNMGNDEEIKDQESNSKGKVVLVIEDDALISNLVKHFLDDYAILQAYSVKEVNPNHQKIYIYIGDRKVQGKLWADICNLS